mmetsp:Transcript_69601/g.145121  ORF Transcript_69601/g.145121 Transcript_69601/m.145121 type:complete len:232 (-) Transcript_69601:1207-1902(-)
MQYTHLLTCRVTHDGGSEIIPSESLAEKQTVSARPSSPLLAAYTSMLRDSLPSETTFNWTREGTSPTRKISTMYGESTSAPVLFRPVDESRATSRKLISHGTNADRCSVIGPSSSSTVSSGARKASSDSCVHEISGATRRMSTQCSSPYQPNVVILSVAHVGRGVESRDMAQILCNREKSSVGRAVQVMVRVATEQREKTPETFQGTGRIWDSHSEGPTTAPFGIPGSFMI